MIYSNRTIRSVSLDSTHTLYLISSFFCTNQHLESFLWLHVDILSLKLSGQKYRLRGDEKCTVYDKCKKTCIYLDMMKGVTICDTLYNILNMEWRFVTPYILNDKISLRLNKGTPEYSTPFYNIAVSQNGNVVHIPEWYFRYYISV